MFSSEKGEIRNEGVGGVSKEGMKEGSIMLRKNRKT
jgi:hypothetical protein